MHDDDRPVGRILTRREVVRLLSISGAAPLFAFDGGSWLPQAGRSLPGCVVQPEQTEGPYFVDQQLNRPDIRVEPSTGAVSPGERLALAVTVSQITGGACRPLPGAMVDVWQCDAKGVYSGVADRRFNTVGQKVLRGVQASDPNGIARFTTIYPGWYSGRTVHIHFKIRTTTEAGAYEFTSQWYFDDVLTDRVLADPRYARTGTRDTYNANDGIFRDGGTQLMLAPTRTDEGLQASFNIGLDLSDRVAARPDGRGAGGRGGRRGAGPPAGRGA